EQLFVEARTMEEAAYNSLIRNEEERRLVQRSKEIQLMKKLADFSLTAEEWGEYKKLSAESREMKADSLKSFEQFYECAEKRNAALVENLTREMEKTNAQVGILIAG